MSEVPKPEEGTLAKGVSPFELARAFAASGYFDDARKISQALVKIAAGQELGLGPLASMTGINLIEGEISLSANLMAALIRRSRVYDYKILELTNQKCVIRFFRKRGSKWEAMEPDSTFDVTDAQVAGLLKPRSAWEKYARNMHFARALSNGFRWHCPELAGGAPLYTPEEFGQVIEGSFMPVEPVKVDEEGHSDQEAEIKPEASTTPFTNGLRQVLAPRSPEVVKDNLLAAADGMLATGGNTHIPLSRGHVAGMMDDIIASEGADAVRHGVLLYLFGETSINDLSNEEMYALYYWLRPYQDTGGMWLPNPQAVREYLLISQMPGFHPIHRQEDA